MEGRRAAESGADYKAIRRGWCLGEPAFKQELLAQMADGFGGHHGGPERAESAAAGAERWVGAELQRLGWDAAELRRRRKSGLRQRFRGIEGASSRARETVDFDTAGTPENANLFISGSDFGQKNVSADVLALTDIGPLFNRKCRMVFDLRKKDLSEADFRYTFIHEFGHALGVKHADVARSGALMSPILNPDLTEPTDADVNAAVSKGWRAS